MFLNCFFITVYFPSEDMRMRLADRFLDGVAEGLDVRDVQRVNCVGTGDQRTVNPPPLMACEHTIEVGASKSLGPGLPIPPHTMPSSGTDIRR